MRGAVTTDAPDRVTGMGQTGIFWRANVLEMLGQPADAAVDCWSKNSLVRVEMPDLQTEVGRKVVARALSQLSVTFRYTTSTETIASDVSKAKLSQHGDQRVAGGLPSAAAHVLKLTQRTVAPVGAYRVNVRTDLRAPRGAVGGRGGSGRRRKGRRWSRAAADPYAFAFVVPDWLEEEEPAGSEAAGKEQPPAPLGRGVKRSCAAAGTEAAAKVARVEEEEEEWSESEEEWSEDESDEEEEDE